MCHLFELNTVFIAGASGFVGRQIARHFSHEGCRVIIGTRSIHRGFFDEFARDGIEVYEYRSTVEDTEFLRRVDTDVVINTANFYSYEHDHANLERILKATFQFPVLLAESAVSARVPLFLQCGSFFEESDLCQGVPVNFYGAAKAAFGPFMKYYASRAVTKFVHFRCADIYGAGDVRPKLLNRLVRLPSDETIYLSGGDQFMDLINVSDVASIISETAKRYEALPRYSSYNISSDHPIRLRDLVRLVAEIRGEGIDAVFDPGKYRGDEVFTYQCRTKNPAWARNRMNIKTGIEKMLEYEKNSSI